MHPRRISTEVGARVLFPRTGFSTKDLVRTYEQLAPVLLPHLAGRPLTLKRFPDDIHGEAFWEKDAPSFTPRWVRTLPVPRKHEPGVIRYISIPDAKTLRWAASIGCVEIDAFLHRYPYITSPTATRRPNIALPPERIHGQAFCANSVPSKITW